MNERSVAEALRALGEAYRGDWSDFDGRSLRMELNGLADHLGAEAHEVTYEALCAGLEVCPVNRCWYEHCPDSDAFGMCAHAVRRVPA